MARKPVRFNAALEPLTANPPGELARAVGEVVARHSYLDWVLGQVMYDLMEISIKQGRVIMKLPRPRVFVTAVKDLFEFHGLKSSFDFDHLAERLEAASVACRELTRSVIMGDAGELYLVRSPWDPGPGGDLQPESQRIDAKLLAAKRKAIEDAVKAAEKLRVVTDKLLRDSHVRRSRPAFDRRQR